MSLVRRGRADRRAMCLHGSARARASNHKLVERLRSAIAERAEAWRTPVSVCQRAQFFQRGKGKWHTELCVQCGGSEPIHLCSGALSGMLLGATQRKNK